MTLGIIKDKDKLYLYNFLLSIIIKKKVIAIL